MGETEVVLGGLSPGATATPASRQMNELCGAAIQDDREQLGVLVLVPLLGQPLMDGVTGPDANAGSLG